MRIHLTLTSVVFEYYENTIEQVKYINLTLTSVVFECCLSVYFNSLNVLFNFNKCCI